MFRSRREVVVAKKVSPTEDWVHTTAGRVGPLAQSAADKVVPLVAAAADAIGTAADKVSPLAHSAADRVAPLAQTAADRVGPLAQTAADRIAPLAGSAVERVTPYAQGAASRVTPLTQTAVGYAQTAADRLGPLASTARGRVTDDLLPRLGALTAATGPLAGVLSRGSDVDEVVVVEEPRRRGRWVTRLLVVGAVGAAVTVAVRKYFGSKDADWQAARPSTPYVPPAPAAAPSADSSTVDTGVTVEEDFAATEPVTPEPAPAAGETTTAPVGLLSVDDNGDVEETVVDQVTISEPVAELPEGEPRVGGARAARWSGEGVYVGTQPPEGFVIKGNDRSMKYHMPEAAGYNRTTAEVWFNSEEAAQQAGFVRAQR